MHTQGFNPYVYCLNNPLSFVDPSGYWNVTLGENWHDFAIYAMATVATAATGGTASAYFIPAIFAYYTTTYNATINGASYNQTQAAGIKAFLGGVISAVGAYGVGKLFGNVIANQLAREILRAFSHGVVQGTSRMLQGGKLIHGFFAGFVSSLAASYGGILASKNVGNVKEFMGSYVIPIVAGGTAETLGGGKFANGAVTGAFVGLFNHGMHLEEAAGNDDEVPTPAEGGYMSSRRSASVFCKQISNSLGIEMSYITEIDRNTGEQLFFVQPWSENTAEVSYNIPQKGSDGYYYHNGNRVIRQDHWAPKQKGLITTGGIAGKDWKYAVKIKGSVFHHDGNGLNIFEYTPMHFEGIRYNIKPR